MHRIIRSRSKCLAVRVRARKRCVKHNKVAATELSHRDGNCWRLGAISVVVHKSIEQLRMLYMAWLTGHLETVVQLRAMQGRRCWERRRGWMVTASDAAALCSCNYGRQGL